MICYLYPEPLYLFFASDLPALLYYSHVTSMAVALFVGIFVYLNAPKALLNKLLLLIALSFSAWVTMSLLIWAGNDGELFAFIWPFFAVSASFLSIFSIYFIYVFLNKRDVSFGTKIVFSLLLLPVLLLAHTDFSVSGFNLAYCDAFEYEGQIFKYYYNGLGFIAVAWILALLVNAYRKADRLFKKQIVLMGLGIELFLISFITIIFVVTELTTQGILEDSRLEYYALFGMTFFMTMIGFLIVKFKTFNIKLIGAEALVVALWFLVASLTLVAHSSTTRLVAFLTLIFTTIAGVFLIRGVKREVQQREQIEELAQSLKRANNRLKELDRMKSEFVSIASHQLRSPLTAIRGYASMVLEGSYGKITDKTAEAVGRIAESAKFMALSVEDYLNVSRIEAGNMKYEMNDFNFKEMTSKVVDELRPTILKKGLLIMFKSDCDGSEMVHADIGKTRQVISNLIDNAMKYTPKGSITVIVHDDIKKKKIYATIQDTGVGMSKETIEGVFEKFVRAKNANNVNTTGTGLGLFVAKKMIEDMGGRVWAESQGEGKGSAFHVELPLLPGEARQVRA